MFITYALSIGCAVALLGLFLEWAGQRNWPKRRKMWGSLILTIGAMGIAPITAQLAGPLPVAAACSCMTLALSLRGYQAAPAATQAPQDIQGEQTVVVPAPVEQAIVVEQEAVIVEEIVAEQEAVIVEEIVAEEEAVIEEEIVPEDEVVIEEEIVAEDEVVIEEEIVADDVAVIVEEIVAEGEVLTEAVNVIEEEVIATTYDEPASVVLSEEMAAWLNVQISSGYEAKANGLWEQAVTAFDAAVAVCADRELKGMLEEELHECLTHLPELMKEKLLQAS